MIDERPTPRPISAGRPAMLNELFSVHLNWQFRPKNGSIGHAFISVHIINSEVYVFIYGRFARTAIGDLIGDGALNYLVDDDVIGYYATELYKMTARVFRVNDTDIQLTKQLFEARWNIGKSIKNEPAVTGISKNRGRVIDTHDLAGSNCATHTVTVLRQVGSKIFGISYTPMTTPFPVDVEEDFLQSYLEKKSLSLISIDVLEVTSKFKDRSPKLPSVFIRLALSLLPCFSPKNINL